MISCHSGIQTSTLMLISGKNYGNIISISLGNQDFPNNSDDSHVYSLWTFGCLKKKGEFLLYIYIIDASWWRKSIDDSLNTWKKLNKSWPALEIHACPLYTLPIKLTAMFGPWKSALIPKGKGSYFIHFQVRTVSFREGKDWSFLVPGNSHDYLWRSED